MKKHRFFILLIAVAFVLFIAACSTPKYKVTFDTDGGSEIAAVEVSKGALVSKPANPNKAGYTFKGWFESDKKTPFLFETFKVTEAITIYAVWDINAYEVTFNVDGGSEIEKTTINHGGLVTKPADPTKAEHTFGGWYKDAEFQTEWNFAIDKITANTTLYAKWFQTDSYTVKFNYEDGSEALEVTVKHGELATAPEAPTRTGYTFGGWFEDGKTEAFDFTAPITKAVNLYAKWDVLKITVTFEVNGGSEIDALMVDYNSLVEEPEAPTKAEFIFGGWYRDAELLIAWNFETIKVTSDTTIYAKWIAVSEPVIQAFDFSLRAEEVEGFDFLTRATAVDTIDGDLTEDITVTHNVTNEVGEYQVIYSVTNSQNKTTTKTITVTVEQATKPYPGLDNRDFHVKHQNINPDIITATFSYDEIDFHVANYQTIYPNNGNLQLERILKDVLEANTSYRFSVTVTASKQTYFMPYLQVMPVDEPYTNLFGDPGLILIKGEEGVTVNLYFTTPAVVSSEYSLSMEFGFAFEVGETGWLNFKDFILIETYEVSFDSTGGSSVDSIFADQGGYITLPEAPTKAGFEFAGWYTDETLETAWDVENDVVNEPITLFAKWEPLIYPEIAGAKDIVVRLEKFLTLNYLEGVTATDANDGDLTAEIEVDSSAVLEAVGSYQVTYTVTNSKGNTDTKTITVTIEPATKEAPYIDTRDFHVKHQNLIDPENTMINVDFDYEQITFTVSNFKTATDNNGNLQVEIELTGYLEANKHYVFEFYVKGPRTTEVQPYLQVIPVDWPWTNVLGIGKQLISSEGQTIRVGFSMPADAATSYSFSIEFGQALEQSETGTFIFSDFSIQEAKAVTFDSNEGSEVAKQYVIPNELLASFAEPTKPGYAFNGWFTDAALTETFDLENEPIVADLTLYAKWIAKEHADIVGAKDLVIRLDQVDGFDYKVGVSAIDAIDEDITANLVVDSTDVLNEVGTYSVVYSIINSRGQSHAVSVDVVVTKTLKVAPAIDNRLFYLGHQHLSRPEHTMIQATFSYEQIDVVVDAFKTNGINMSNVKLEVLLHDYLEANATYVFTFKVKASKVGQIRPYMQKLPIDAPWANLFGEQMADVTTEETTVSLSFNTADVVSGYALALEFGAFFNQGESGTITIKDIALTKQ